MKKIILNITASLDQRIAESDGGLEWLFEFPYREKTDCGHKDLLTSVDTVLIGGRAYQELLNMDVVWKYKEQTIYVVSHHDWGTKENLHYIKDNVIEAISALRNEQGKNILLLGGGELVSMLLAADLIDEMRITYLPVILGEGIPLFPKQPKESIWELKNVKRFNSDVVMVEYRNRNDL